MKVNFYYEFPNAEKISSLEESSPALVNNTNYLAMLLLSKALRNKHPDIKFEEINQAILRWQGKEYKYFRCGLVLENPENGKFFLISQCDRVLTFLPEPNFYEGKTCVEIFTYLGVHYPIGGNESNLVSDFKPWFKYTRIKPRLDAISAYPKIESLFESNQKNDNRITPDKLTFRGTLYGRRGIFIGRPEFELLAGRIDHDCFLEELNQNNINIDLSGAVEITNRAWEIMGLGCALIRTKPMIEFQEPLIPDYHYLCAKPEIESDSKLFVDAHVEAFEKLKKDKDLQVYLANNARKWYERNISMEAHVNSIINKLDFTKLL